MAQKTSKKSSRSKTSTLRTVNRKNRKLLALLSALTIAIVGAVFLYFAKAAANHCSPVPNTNGGICDLNQASSRDGTDATMSVNDEVLNLVKGGWNDWGVA